MRSSAGYAAAMADKPALLPEAANDLHDAYAWYECQRSGLGEEFLGCVEAGGEHICRNPEWFPITHDHFRRALVREGKRGHSGLQEKLNVTFSSAAPKPNAAARRDKGG